MNWQIGDRAIVVNGASCGPHACDFSGQEVVLLRLYRDKYWEVGKLTAIHESALRPIPDEYDGKQVITWDECPYFTPRELERVTV